LRRGNLEVIDYFKTEIAEFIPNVRGEIASPKFIPIIRELAMTALRDPLAKTAKRLFQQNVSGGPLSILCAFSCLRCIKCHNFPIIALFMCLFFLMFNFWQGYCYY
jgi:hypothetical protein